MPWLTCTTGSPTFSSERSLMSALTSLVCSWRRRRRALGAVAKSSVSVTNSIVVAAAASPATPDGAGAVAQQLEQALAAALAFGDDEDAVRGRGHVRLQSAQRLWRAAVDTQIGQRRRPASDRIVAAANEQLRLLAATAEKFFRLQEQCFRRQDRPLAVVLKKAMALARVGPETLQRGIDLAVQRHRGGSAEVVEQRRRFVEEKWQVVLDAGRGDAG